ncbi:hypothetical protein PAXRUDRAFT_164857 [Paxillus rubicundulus Ve08.2h10]|uniref:Uncharacterized protein n=1 Tax=Paxillus rubicundulus Ve08.2h10 TaxID=930991 RepID=A0A0D0DJ12_9AGAM|nr:hypothetical protein PAXRUDRAFT_164857 [Paxillus rubicundulus Ve08.2h10]
MKAHTTLQQFCCPLYKAQGVSNANSSLVVNGMLQHMINNSQEASGTVQDVATETAFDELTSYLHVQPGPTVSLLQRLSDAARVALHVHYNQHQHSVHSPQSTQLSDFAFCYQFALWDGCHITPLSRTLHGSAVSSIVKVKFNNISYYGEVLSIFSHTQPGIADGTWLLVKFQWMMGFPLSPVKDDPWSKFPELDIVCFKLNKYWTPNQVGCPLAVLPFNQITGQIGHGVINTMVLPMWITTTLDRVSSIYVTSDVHV